MSAWCVVYKRGAAVYGPFEGMHEAYEHIDDSISMAEVDVKPMRSGRIE